VGESKVEKEAIWQNSTYIYDKKALTTRIARQ
jgi:hypothetical protein